MQSETQVGGHRSLTLQSTRRGGLRFIDLFAGLGGFHLALSELGHECVFASELDPYLRELYWQNYRVRPEGDIRLVSLKSIPSHDVLCAGFPCQPFSKAGEQLGLECPEWGDLFGVAMRIARYHKPQYLLLENVANLEKHDNGRTWRNRLLRRINDAGYKVVWKLLSPHEFGVPQVRPRFFIVASRSGLDHFKWPEPTSNLKQLSIHSILDDHPGHARRLSKQVTKCLDVWQNFLDLYPGDEELPSFPIWSMEFGATYPFEQATPFSTMPSVLARKRGSHGFHLGTVPPRERLGHIPSYASEKRRQFPDWKVSFIRQNRELYQKHRTWIDRWLPRILPFPPSLQKLEWNCKGETRDIRSFVLQFRASGVRVKRPHTAPSLVAMTTTQVPVIGWEDRYLTTRECSRLQCMDRLQHLPTASGKAYKALGNAVNVKIVRLIAEQLLRKQVAMRAKG